MNGHYPLIGGSNKRKKGTMHVPMKQNNKDEKTLIKLMFALVIMTAINLALMVAIGVVWFIFASKSQEFGSLLVEGVQMEREMNTMIATSTVHMEDMATSYAGFLERHTLFFTVIEDVITRIENEFELGRLTNTNGRYFKALSEVPDNLIQLTTPLKITLNELNNNGNMTSLIHNLTQLYIRVTNMTAIATEIEQRFLNNGKIQITF